MAAGTYNESEPSIQRSDLYKQRLWPRVHCKPTATGFSLHAGLVTGIQTVIRLSYSNYVTLVGKWFYTMVFAGRLIRKQIVQPYSSEFYNLAAANRYRLSKRQSTIDEY